MRLLQDRVLVKPIIETKTSSSLLIIPEGSQKKNKGEVVLIGVDVTRLNVGDIVIYHDHVGIDLDYHGQPHLVLREGDEKRPGEIIGVI